MTRFLALCLFLAGPASYLAAQGPNEPSLKQLFDSHSWFALREAAEGKALPALYRGTLAAAFNRVDEAEKHLKQAIREAASPLATNEARGKLAILYLRLGRSSDAARLIDDILDVEPERNDVRNLGAIFGAFRGRGNQRVQSHRRASFRCDVSPTGVHLPLSINGRTVEWLLDTGANVTLMSEAEANMLGLVVRNSTGEARDLAGGASNVRTVVIDRVVIGQTALRNVVALVLPDARGPWSDLPPGKQGLIGLPAALPLQALRWTKDGTCHTGATPDAGTASPRNLVFDDLFAVARVEFEGQQLEFILDTGNQAGTQLWERFARDFPVLVKEQGRKSTTRVTQFGGSNERETTMVPDLRLRLGGADAVLRPAEIFSKPVGNDRHHGNLGMNVLSQAAEVTLDFGSMSLVLR